MYIPYIPYISDITVIACFGVALMVICLRLVVPGPV